MTSAQIRRQFIEFFVQKHGHSFVPSSPVVPLDDPTLLFANAGMNQFKPIFLGQEKRAYTRAVDTQKCIRAGGKHNDLDDVGRSRRHHTFFEMLGNWSFGDYFKQGAIEMAWELLTQVWKLDPTRLHVSCYVGNEAAGIPRDTEAAEIWKKVAQLPDDHIHYFGKDNFWEMGDTGPCGPCTEIYVDRTPNKTGGPEVNGNDPRVMEIWNLVFIQYDSYFEPEGAAALREYDNAQEPERARMPYKDRQAVLDKWRKLRVLPAQHVDTGMGLERICQVLQGKDDNYAIDLFTPIFDALTKMTGIKYCGQFPPTNAADPVAEAANPKLRHDIAFRVIADHIRCLTFALTDGAVPSNEGRGYVLRRILRRAVFWGRKHLSLERTFLHELVDVVASTMGDTFPELRANPRHVVEMIRDEEISFGRTIDRGIDLFEEAADRAKWNDQKRLVLQGEDAFKLHDTYGFPIDLTRIMAEERGMLVDMAEYERLMKLAQETARSGGRTEDTSLLQLPPDVLSQLTAKGLKPTDDQAKYQSEPIPATVKAIWTGSALTDSIAPDSKAAAILDRTNFYAEMGGQVGDVGTLRTNSGALYNVETTRVVGGYVVHVGKLDEGVLKVNDQVTATVAELRHRTQQSHTTTHVANWALREVLGDNVQQKGSLVDPEKLRFDFSHGKAMSEEEIERVEDLVNSCISERMPVYAEVVPQEKALKIHGLRAVFGEKYPPMVRVVSIGKPVAELLAGPENPEWRKYSIEFCGGTHLKNTAEAVMFVITAEESISKGVRRIIALTGDAAQAVVAQGKSVDSVVEVAATKPDAELPNFITALQKSVSSGELSLRAKRRAQAAVMVLQERYRKWDKAQKAQGATKIDVGELSTKLLEFAQVLGQGKLVVANVPGAANEQLLSLVDSLKKKSGSYAILLGAADDSKVNFVAAVSDDLIAKGLKAGDWIRDTAKATGGGGGGRPQLAQAGGKDPAKLPEALEVARKFALKAVGG
jgi:alanyl-tRNA synthetase